MKTLTKESIIEVLKKKLHSMRYSKKAVQKETSRYAKQFMYGYTECINDLLEYLNTGSDGLPEHDLFQFQQPESGKQPTDQDIRKYFDKWIIKTVGIQDAGIFYKGTLVRDVAIKYAKAMRDNEIPITDK